MPIFRPPRAHAASRNAQKQWRETLFTDEDRDVVRAAPGELVARIPDPVPLGTTGLVLELTARRD